MSPARVTCIFFLMIFFVSESWSGREKFIDPLDVASAKSDFAIKSNLVGVTRAGSRLITVGQLGHILFSDNDGAQWKQASVPVSTDLVAVYFSNDKLGWAVGHDGVILHSEDAGASWQQQMGGRQLMGVANAYYSSHRAANDDEAALRQQSLAQFETGAPAFTFLDVWFRNDYEGYVVGAFNLIFKTVDGGKNWAPWFDRTDNPRGYHLYSIQGDGKNVYVVGELGLMLHLDERAQRFTALNTPYQGSFFGVMVNGERIIGYGLRGNAFTSEDAGKSWDKLVSPTDESFTAGVWSPKGDALLVSQNGELFRAIPNSLNLRKVEVGNGFASNAAVLTKEGGTLAVVGPWGVKQLQLN